MFTYNTLYIYHWILSFFQIIFVEILEISKLFQISNDFALAIADCKKSNIISKTCKNTFQSRYIHEKILVYFINRFMRKVKQQNTSLPVAFKLRSRHFTI